MEQIKYGTSIIDFKIVYSNRKTLGISVLPDLSVVVKAPENTTKKVIFQKVEKRASWIIEQQNYFLTFQPRKKEYLYKSGETHYYLGRQYLLKIELGKEEEVYYKGRYLLIITKNKSKENVKKLLEKWYRKRAKIKFAEIAEPLIQKFKKYDVEPKNLYIQQMQFRPFIQKFKKYDVEPKKIYIQQMQFRWGSCTLKDNVILNPELIKAPKPCIELIKAPKPCIEYVIVHELCHLLHPNHSNIFFKLQSREMPDWKKWKDKLEVFMA